MRWRIGAAVIDNLIIYALYLLVCLVLDWQVVNLGHLVVLLVIDVLYHLMLESREGQTIGKRRYGIRVLAVDDRPAAPRAIAIRSLLRIIDALPFWYLSGLVTMVHTGPQRRQRIGDVAAATKVVAVDGRAVESGTPGWLLPAATLAALAVSAVSVLGFAEAGQQPLSRSQQAEFISGCERGAGAAVINCQCLLNRLQADGYTTPDSLRSVVAQAEAERLDGQAGTARSELTADALGCSR